MHNRHFFSFFAVASPLREDVEVFGVTPHLLNVSGHRRRLVRRTVERLVRIFFHAGLCQFEMVRGVCAGCWWGDRSRLELFVIATPRCRADRIISRRPRYAREPFGVGVLLFCCVLTGLLFYYSNVSDHRRRLVRRTVERLVRIFLSCGVVLV